MSLKKKSRYDPRIGKLLFIIPAVLIILLVSYAFIQLNSPGVVIVQAFAQGGGAQLNVPVNVGNHTGTTPLKISLSQGAYTVSYGAVLFYQTPSPRTVTVTPGLTVYANALYSPVTDVVSVTPAGFNTTALTVEHGVTPVVWINPSSSSVRFAGGPFTAEILDSGQNVTYTFPAAGSYPFTVYDTNETMTIQVL